MSDPTDSNTDGAERAEELEKGFKDSRMMFQASKDAHAAHTASIVNKPMIAKPHKSSLPSPEEQASRAASLAEFTPDSKFKKEEMDKGDYGMSESGRAMTAPAVTSAAPAKFKGSDLKVGARGSVSGPGLKFSKTINESYSPEANMSKDGVNEVLKTSANGQWSLDKALTSDIARQSSVGTVTAPTPKAPGKPVSTDVYHSGAGEKVGMHRSAGPAKGANYTDKGAAAKPAGSIPGKKLKP